MANADNIKSDRNCHGSVSERLARNSRQEGDCVVWTGAVAGHGYGKMRVPRGYEYTHRVSWSLAYGEIPAGMHVCHRCDNPPCINPDHLFIGTHAENMADKVAKGRHGAPRGERHYKAKLTEENVREIRSSSLTLDALALRFGVSFQSISKIRTGKQWKHVPKGERGGCANTHPHSDHPLACKEHKAND